MLTILTCLLFVWIRSHVQDHAREHHWDHEWDIKPLLQTFWVKLYTDSLQSVPAWHLGECMVSPRREGLGGARECWCGRNQRATVCPGHSISGRGYEERGDELGMYILKQVTQGRVITYSDRPYLGYACTIGKHIGPYRLVIRTCVVTPISPLNTSRVPLRESLQMKWKYAQ